MGIAYNTSIVRDGLVLHLDAANVKSYPGSGTVWKDLSGNGNDVTLLNGVEFNSTNKCFVFDGTDDYGFNSGENLKPDMVSVFAIAKNNDLTQSVSFIAGYGNTGYNGYWIGQTGGSYRVSVGNGGYYKEDTTGAAQISIKAKTSNLEFLGGTFDGNNIMTYDRGNIVQTVPYFNAGTLDYSNLNAGFLVGNVEGFSSLRYWTGEIHSIFVYSRVLTIIEIQQNFEALRGRYGI